MKAGIQERIEYGGPVKLLCVEQDEEGNGEFDVLYRRLGPLKRFGRTGRIDLLVLLLHLQLITTPPRSCHLQGATGPLQGARLLWGDRRSPGELDVLATELADRLGVSTMVMEDALCNWQK